MLLLTSLTAGNVIPPVAAIALVLGANLGGAIPPVLEASSADPAARRLPIGNLAFRALGCVVALPFARLIAEALTAINSDPAASVVNFHLIFNLILAVVFAHARPRGWSALRRPGRPTGDARMRAMVQALMVGATPGRDLPS
jgi:Na+/phosphate symporter